MGHAPVLAKSSWVSRCYLQAHALGINLAQQCLPSVGKFSSSDWQAWAAGSAGRPGWTEGCNEDIFSLLADLLQPTDLNSLFPSWQHEIQASRDQKHSPFIYLVIHIKTPITMVSECLRWTGESSPGPRASSASSQQSKLLPEGFFSLLLLRIFIHYCGSSWGLKGRLNQLGKRLWLDLHKLSASSSVLASDQNTYFKSKKSVWGGELNAPNHKALCKSPAN